MLLGCCWACLLLCWGALVLGHRGLRTVLSGLQPLGARFVPVVGRSPSPLASAAFFRRLALGWVALRFFSPPLVLLPVPMRTIPGSNDSRDALLFGTFRTVGVVWWERGVAVGLGLFGRDLYCFHPYHPFHLFHLCRQPVAYGTLFVPRLGLVSDLLGGLGVFRWTPFVGSSRRSTVVPR